MSKALFAQVARQHAANLDAAKQTAESSKRLKKKHHPASSSCKKRHKADESPREGTARSLDDETCGAPFESKAEDAEEEEEEEESECSSRSSEDEDEDVALRAVVAEEQRKAAEAAHRVAAYGDGNSGDAGGRYLVGAQAKIEWDDAAIEQLLRRDRDDEEKAAEKAREREQQAQGLTSVKNPLAKLMDSFKVAEISFSTSTGSSRADDERAAKRAAAEKALAEAVLYLARSRPRRVEES